MAVLSNTGIRAGAAGATGDAEAYQVKRSARFNAGDSAYLSKTFASAGNRTKWTWSGWVKRTNPGATQFFFSGGPDGNNDTDQITVFFESDDQLRINSGASVFLETTQVFRDPTAWYHIVVVADTGNATANDRIKLYVNGSQVTDFATRNNPTQGANTGISAAVEHRLGKATGSSYSSDANSFNGYLCDVHFVDGFAKTPGDFAETDSTTGQWVPKEYKGAHSNPGTATTWSNTYTASNSFQGAAPATAGFDGNTSTRSACSTAGCTVTFTPPTPISVNTSLKIYAGYGSASVNGGGAVSFSGSGVGWQDLSFTGALTSLAVTGNPSGGTANAGEIYAIEVDGTILEDGDVVGKGTNGFHLAMDPANTSDTIFSNYLTTTGNVSYDRGPQDAFRGKIWSFSDASNSGFQTDGTGSSITFAPPAGSLVGQVVVLYQRIRPSTVTVNGTAATITTSGDIRICTVDLGSSQNITSVVTTATTNGQTNSFSYLKVDGKLIVDGGSSIGHDSSGNKNHWYDNNIFADEHTVANENFKIVTYTGTGSSQTINCGFQPDFVWIKKRSGGTARVHALYDSVRGVQKTLESNSTDAEYADTNALTHFTTTGFTVGSEDRVNENTYPYVAWCWKGAGTGVANDTGTLDSTVSANTTAGFSVVKYTMGGGDVTVGHGLSAEPDFIITRRYSSNDSWITYHQSLGKDKYLFLNSSDDAFTDTADAFTSTNSSVFDARAGLINAGDCIAYCWNETDGVSKFGSYTGNGSSTGPVIDCGFAPAWLMVKRTDNDGQHWVMWDKARDSTNPNTWWLYANTSAAEGHNTDQSLDFLPNGFQPRDSNWNMNNNGSNYIFVAFAGNPAGDLDLLADVPGAPYDNELNGGGNYATWNPLSGTNALANGNLDCTFASGTTRSVFANTYASSGKWYAEFTCTALAGGDFCQVGVAPETAGFTPGSGTGEWQSNPSYMTNGNKHYHDGGQTWAGAAFGDTWGEGDTIGMALNMDAGTATAYKNGVSQGTLHSGMTNAWGFWGRADVSPTTLRANFGQRPFKYTPPADHKAMNTYNISDPTVVKGNTGFEAKTYTGTGSSGHGITGFEFSPDLVWMKERGGSANHKWHDIIRGTNLQLQSNTTDADETVTNQITSFDTNGFTLGDSNDVNQSGEDFVAWCWDAGTANVTKNAYSSGIDTNHAPLLFDGDLTTFYAPDGSNHTWTAPSAITVSTKLEIWYKSSVAARDFEVNDSGTTINTGTSASGKWVDLNFTGSLTKIEGTNGWQVAAIRVDDSILTEVGNLTSTYRVNTDTGFSIVSYSGGGSGSANTDSGDTFAHGLNAAPQFVICKKRSGANGWPVYHASTALGALVLSSENALDTASYLFAKKHPTSTVVYLGNNPEINATGSDYIAYCWSEVSGYSKFGSYTGNGSTDGPFVWCGFRPRWIMLKSTGGSRRWVMLDTARQTLNGPDNGALWAERSDAESENSENNVDFLSNGFKMKCTNGNANGSGETYIFAAFAEYPFKYSNAR